MKLRSITSTKLSNKKIVLRVDFNVTLVDGIIKDDTRIKETLPTIEYLLKNGNSLTLLSHLGRPKGQINEKYSLTPVVKRLENLLNRKVILFNQFRDTSFPSAQNLVMLENVRFDPGDEQNDLSYAKKLASFGELFVNDAFAVCHRSHASTVGLSKILPSFAGLLLEKEITILRKVLDSPTQPVVCVISGAKISDKIGLIKKQLDLAQTVILGGGIANTFLKAQGKQIGNSLVENEALELAKELLFLAATKHSALYFPTDFSVLTGNAVSNKKLADIEKNDSIMDVGVESRKLFADVIQKASTVVFNGPLGKYEDERFAQATKYLLKVVAQSKALSVIGGGDTLACISDKETAEGITHISTGGGAMLEFMEKGSLPGIDVLYS